MKSPNDEGERAPNGHLFSPYEASGARNGLHLIELIKGALWESPNNPNIKTVPLHKMTARSYCWKQYLHNFYVRGLAVLHRLFTPTCYCLWCRKVLCVVPRINVNTNPATNPSICNSVLVEMLGKWWHRACGSNQCLIWPKAYSMRWDPYLTLPG